MADEKDLKDVKPPAGGNGDGGNGAGLMKEIRDINAELITKTKEQVEGLKDPTKTQVFTSIFRHKHDNTPRNRALGVLSNVFLHLTRPRSIATPCATATPGAWAASLSTCSSC